MFKVEKKLLEIIDKNVNIIMFVFITFLALVLRSIGMRFISTDMVGCLIPWFNTIKDGGGLLALSQQVGNYNVLYQTIIAIMTYIDMDPVYLYKILSIIFDFLLAYFSASFVCYLKHDKEFSTSFYITYSIVLCLPNFVFVSSYWGQCDSIYSCFVIIALLLLFKSKYLSSFIFLGIALSFKLQTVFIIPFFLFDYVKEKKFSFLLFFIPFLVLIASGLPATLFGRDIFDTISIYFAQTSEYPSMNMNFNSFWNIVGSDYGWLCTLAILTTITILAIMMFYIYKNNNINYLDNKLEIAVLFTWTVILFLPSMHDRYDYLLSILLIVLSIYKKRYFVSTVTSLCISITTYSGYLFGWANGGVTNLTTYIALFAYFYFAGSVFKGFFYNPN